jgi:putative membrane protein
VRLVAWFLANAVGLAVAAWLLDGISFGGSDWQDKLPELLLTALILGLVSFFVKPLVNLLSIPLIILTFGLFLLVTNALMLLLTGWLADKVDVGFEVDGFWTALIGALVITLVAGFVDLVLPDGD